MKPFWITFYSYKGGVGRSLALANTAALLVQRGRRVVLIDFDLEAPGLDSFEEFKCIAGKPGVVEYVTKYKETKRAPGIDQFIHHCDLPGPLRGNLWIMPAGRKDQAYNASRAKLNWADLYENYQGELFVENWKAALARHCQPDYVLVDSRTGLTDVGGICTLHLPDLVVMMFGLNEQNVRGVAAVAKTIRESESSKLPQIHYVASPVPNLPRDKKGPLVRRLSSAAEQLGAKIGSTIRYQQLAALSERLFVLDPDLAPSQALLDFAEDTDTPRRFLSFSHFPLVQDYNDLLSSLIDYNRSGLDFISDQTTEAIKQMDLARMERLRLVFEQEFPDRPEALMARALLLRARGGVPDGENLRAARDLATQALTLDPAYAPPFKWLSAEYKREGDFSSALKVCDTVLRYFDRLPPDRQLDLHTQRGQVAMAAGDYAAADKSYTWAMAHLTKQKKRGDTDPESLMIHMFNVAEAARRATGESRAKMWGQVATLFMLTGAGSAAPLVNQANRWQAMHIPFALTGDLPTAREALAKARQAAERLGRTEDVFTVKTYRDVPVQEFLAINDQMLAALDKGQLWDGMPLLASQKPDLTPPASD